MRIERVELFPLRLPLKKPFVTAAGSVDVRELAVLKITDGDGHVGLGEITPYPTGGDSGLGEFIRGFALDVLPRLDGCDIKDTDKALEHFKHSLPPQTVAAVDTALIDLKAHAKGVRFADMLSEHVNYAVKVNSTIADIDADDVAESGRRALAAGFKTVKLKVGLPEDDWRLGALRAAVGYETRIRLDANGAWYSGEAVEILRSLSSHGIELLEQPVSPGDLIGMHKVRDAAIVPIVADEGVRTIKDFENHVENGACDGVAIKLSQVGGPTLAAALADRVEAAGMFSFVTSTLDGPVGLAASLHFAASRSEIDLACGLATADIFQDTYAYGLPQVADGALEVGNGIGLGLTLDEAALIEYAAT
jgi:o-succinylbenzoate synthase